MSPDIDITSGATGSDARVHIRLRDPELFDLATRLIGLVTDAQRGARFGVNARTVRRARNGKPVGEQFMGRAVAALQGRRDLLTRVGIEPTLDGLFEVVVETGEAAA